MQYLVQMKIVVQGRATSPEARTTLVENYIFPSLEMCRKLREEKKILAGGPISGTIGIAMIVEAASPLELDGIFESLPLWPLMEPSVTPLTTFEDRVRAIHARLERDKADAHK
jgi:Muconolactone delta-isomerase